MQLFFIPAATDETKESVYESFAKRCNIPVPKTNARIYSIVFRHDGETWTATVGETLKGVHHLTKKLRGAKIERSTPVSDPALVLAIFPGNPFMVVTNQGTLGNVRSSWANPFLAGAPDSITYFSS